MLLAGVETAAVSTLQPSRYDDARPCVYQDVTKAVPVNHPPSARYAHGRSRSPDHPTNTNRSNFSQSSTSSNHPRSSSTFPTISVINDNTIQMKRYSQYPCPSHVGGPAQGLCASVAVLAARAHRRRMAAGAGQSAAPPYHLSGREPSSVCAHGADGMRRTNVAPTP